MAYLFKKKVRGIFSLYMGENARVDSVSKRIKSKYLGPLERFEKYFAGSQTSIESVSHYEYGLSYTLKLLMDQFLFQKIFHNNLHKRIEDPYLDKRIVLMVMNRLCDPCAKYALDKWFCKTNLVNTYDLPERELEAQKIYRAMDQLELYSEDIENEICKTIMIQEKINLDPIYLDFTNQESYSKNEDSDLLEYGHNKRGHHDLLQVNLSLSCDSVSGIPFFHKSYPGNHNDKQFIKSYTSEFREKFDLLGYTGRITLIIDRGINGKKDFELLRENRFDYIGGLIESEFPKYFNIPKSRLRNTYTHKRETKKDIIIKYSYTKDKIYGGEHLIITLYNEENYEEKKASLDKSLNKYKEDCEKQLYEFKKEISEKTFQSFWNNTEKMLKKLKDINKKKFSLLRFNLSSYRFDLKWKISDNKKEYSRYLDNLGKYVLFSNKTKMKPDDVINLFYGKQKIEKNFHYLKSNGYTNRYIRMGPMLHSKDQRIKSHNYTCVLALQIYQIINHRLKKKNLDLSVQNALEELKTITRYYIKTASYKAPLIYTTPLTSLQKEILHALEIEL